MLLRSETMTASAFDNCLPDTPLHSFARGKVGQWKIFFATIAYLQPRRSARGSRVAFSLPLLLTRHLRSSAPKLKLKASALSRHRYHGSCSGPRGHRPRPAPARRRSRHPSVHTIVPNQEPGWRGELARLAQLRRLRRISLGGRPLRPCVFRWFGGDCLPQSFLTMPTCANLTLSLLPATVATSSGIHLL